MIENGREIKVVYFGAKFVEATGSTITFENPLGEVLSWDADRNSLRALGALSKKPEFVYLRVELPPSGPISREHPPTGVQVTVAPQGYCGCTGYTMGRCNGCNGGRCQTEGGRELTCVPSSSGEAVGFYCGCI